MCALKLTLCWERKKDTISVWNGTLKNSKLSNFFWASVSTSEVGNGGQQFLQSHWAGGRGEMVTEMVADLHITPSLQFHHETSTSPPLESEFGHAMYWM